MPAQTPHGRSRPGGFPLRREGRTPARGRLPVLGLGPFLEPPGGPRPCPPPCPPPCLPHPSARPSRLPLPSHGFPPPHPSASLVPSPPPGPPPAPSPGQGDGAQPPRAPQRREGGGGRPGPAATGRASDRTGWATAPLALDLLVGQVSGTRRGGGGRWVTALRDAGTRVG